MDGGATGGRTQHTEIPKFIHRGSRNARNNRNGRTTSESASRERSCAAVGLSLRSPESSATHASLAYDCLRHMTVRAAKRVEHVKRLRALELGLKEH